MYSYPRRLQVSAANEARLRALPGALMTYTAHDQSNMGFTSSQLDDRLMAPSRLRLKIGAQILLIRNLEQGQLVNGTVGRIVGFGEEGSVRSSPSLAIGGSDGRHRPNQPGGLPTSP